MQHQTTIKLDEGTKKELDSFREVKGESYNEVVKKLVFIAKMIKQNPKLSKKTIEEIEAARARIKKGEFYTETEMRKRLNL
ncbi:MAG: hypothetical protein IB618_01385 [Candidatus Pacearchaeota archaeon]|nr:MAG: hypothetical protein IB618_01385 [Candidatus Pacearchaeota archaeon]